MSAVLLEMVLKQQQMVYELLREEATQLLNMNFHFDTHTHTHTHTHTLPFTINGVRHIVQDINHDLHSLLYDFLQS